METWKDIEGYEGLYQVSDQGRVKSLARQVRAHVNNATRTTSERILSNCIGSHGYPVVVLNDKGRKIQHLVHRLVAKSFIPNPTPDKFNMVNHKDNCKTNNTVGNLEWTNQTGNMRHAGSLGLMSRNTAGENHPACKLTNAQVYEIRAELAKGLSKRSLSRKYKVSPTTIWDIASGKSWSHI